MSVPTRAEGALLERARQVPSRELDDLLAPTGAVLVIAPHPDDETLGCGLAIRAALAGARDVVVLLLTGGGASHPKSRACPPNAMKSLRRREFVAALDALRADLPRGAGALSHLMLDLPDGKVSSAGAAADRALANAIAISRAVEAGTVWVTWSGDPHADHQAASRLADRLCARVPKLVRRDYAVWGRFRNAGSSVRSQDLLPFDAPRHRPAKRRAMDAYRSQLTEMIADDPSGFVMPPTLVEHFASTPELFLRHGGGAREGLEANRAVPA